MNNCELKKKLTYEEKKINFLKDEEFKLDVINIEKIRDIFYFIKEYNYNLLQKMELYNFEEFIKKNSSIYIPEEYVETSDEDRDDDY